MTIIISFQWHLMRCSYKYFERGTRSSEEHPFFFIRLCVYINAWGSYDGHGDYMTYHWNGLVHCLHCTGFHLWEIGVCSVTFQIQEAPAHWRKGCFTVSRNRGAALQKLGGTTMRSQIIPSCHQSYKVVSTGEAPSSSSFSSLNTRSPRLACSGVWIRELWWLE